MPRISKRVTRVMGVAFALWLAFGGALIGAELTVAAATSLQGAFREVASTFKDTTGVSTTLVFGSSGALAHQIENGAPYDVFASANEQWVKRLIDKGRLRGESIRHYAEGVLAWVHMSGAQSKAQSEALGAAALRKHLASNTGMIALAHPNLAPYGTAAREALQKAGLWERLRERIVFADNVRQALTYLETGNVDAALVAASLLADHKGRWDWQPIDGSLHGPIRQSLGIVANSPRTMEARRFAEFLTGITGRAILKRYGFRLPAPPTRSFK